MIKKHALSILIAALIIFPVTLSQAQDAPVIYELPTVKVLSQLYWGLLKFDPDDNDAIDNFLMINECDLYKQYLKNEFEWSSVRESAADFLVTNRGGFTKHIEFMQPLRLKEYDIETKKFEVWQPYKIESVRRFQVLATDIHDKVCGRHGKYHIKGYPKALLVELNRPFLFTEVDMSPELAKAYIEYKHGVDPSYQNYVKKRSDIYNDRHAYIVMKVRLFSYKQDVRMREHIYAKVMGVLEGYEIYADQKREFLLFSRNFTKKKVRSKMEMEMKKRYQERLKKQLEKKKEDDAFTEVLKEKESL